MAKQPPENRGANPDKPRNVKVEPDPANPSNILEIPQDSRVPAGAPGQAPRGPGDEPQGAAQPPKGADETAGEYLERASTPPPSPEAQAREADAERQRRGEPRHQRDVIRDRDPQNSVPNRASRIEGDVIQPQPPPPAPAGRPAPRVPGEAGEPTDSTTPMTGTPPPRVVGPGRP